MTNSRMVKICGNRYPEDSFYVASLKPDFMGWIFSDRSPRKVPVVEAVRYISRIRREQPSIRHVAVFAGNSVEEIRYVLRNIPLIDYIQVVEGSGFVNNLRNFLRRSGFSHERLNELIVPAVRVREPVDDSDLTVFGHSPFYILDAYVPGIPGGTGKKINMEYIEGVRSPYLIAGGLKPDNVIPALMESFAIGADVSSGVEDDIPGRKNQEKVAKFISRVRDVSGIARNPFATAAMINASEKRQTQKG